MNLINEFKDIKGFYASGTYSGIKKDPTTKDIALIYSDTPAVSASVYTKNLACAAPVIISKQHKNTPHTQAIIINSGNANACTGDSGLSDAIAVVNSTAEALKILPTNVLTASTGIIGVPLPKEKIIDTLSESVKQLSQFGFDDAAKAIMTTDTFSKVASISFTIEGEEVIISGMAKGSGMIHPNMATMLGVMTTNANISKEMLQNALSHATDKSYNMITVDGDTSTNDMVAIMSNQSLGHQFIDQPSANFKLFQEALTALSTHLAIMIAKDGEGATKLIEVHVRGAATEISAQKMAKTVVSSSLVKSALFGNDANWGRIVCALGYSGESFDPNSTSVTFKSKAGILPVFKDGLGITFEENHATKVLSEEEVIIAIHMTAGGSEAKAWGCDLTYDYVKINGDYRS